MLRRDGHRADEALNRHMAAASVLLPVARKLWIGNPNSDLTAGSGQAFAMARRLTRRLPERSAVPPCGQVRGRARHGWHECRPSLMVYRLVLGLRKPWHVIPGTELSGVVEAVGRQVIHFSFGDPVLAFPGGRMGRQAGYRCRAADGPVCFRPANLSHQQAASHCFGGTSMLDLSAGRRWRPSGRLLVVPPRVRAPTRLDRLSRRFHACAGWLLPAARSAGRTPPC